VRLIKSHPTGCLVGCLTARQDRKKGQFVPTAGGGKPAQSAKDDQRDTMHITLSYMITKQCNTIHSKTLQLHKRNSRRAI